MVVLPYGLIHRSNEFPKRSAPIGIAEINLELVIEGLQVGTILPRDLPQVASRAVASVRRRLVGGFEVNALRASDGLDSVGAGEGVYGEPARWAGVVIGR